jgi:DNA-binding MarR family transcriptional regulator
MQAGRLALEMAARALDLYELTVTEFAALQLVRSFGGICQSAIAERLGISRAAMSGIAMTLDRRGLIDRRQDMFDPGRRAIYLTTRGQELLADASQALAPVDSHFRGCLGEEASLALAQLPPRSPTPIELAQGFATRV